MSKFGTDALFLNKKELLKVLLDWEYPVGKGVKITFDNVNPGTYLGGTWEALPEGYALWTTTKEINDENEGKDTTTVKYRKIPAGLPNITGSISGWYVGRNANNTATGALSASSSSTRGSQGNDGTTGLKIDFNANDGAVTKGVYGNSSTVQPPAIKVFVWKRIG